MKALVKKGLTPKQAVNFAYKQFPVMQTMHDEIYGQLGNEMVRGYGGDLPHEAIADALALSWTGDGLTLSDRTTAGSKIVKGFVRSTIEQEIRKGTNYKKLALKLFNGYKQGGLIPEQDIPKFMSKLIHASVGPGYNQKEFDRDFSKVQKQVAKLNTPGMRAAYTALLGAIEARNDQKLNKAIYGATQERTRYFAERIARTEMARAYNDGAMAKYMEDDDIEAVQWKLSSAHPCYDICDLYANADLYGLGKGIFPKDKVPMLPAHPNCMCHLKPVVVSQSTKRLPHERFEQGAREYISTASKAHRERLFGKHGSKLVESGSPIVNHLRNYNAEKSKTRLTLPVVKELDRITVSGNTYVVDDKHVRLDHTEEERTIAKVLANYLGKDVELAPRVLMPQNVRTPDYIVDGTPYELKTPTGTGPNTVFDMIKHGKGQASHFVINIDKTQLSKNEVLAQIERVFNNKRTEFVKTVITIKHGEVINRRKK